MFFECFHLDLVLEVLLGEWKAGVTILLLQLFQTKRN